MILRAIFGTLVFIFFVGIFIRRIQKDREENKKVSKWSVFFIVVAVILWAGLMIPVLDQIM